MDNETQNTTSATAIEEKPAHLDLVEKVLQSLVKLINGKKLYAENNPRLAEFGREFDTALLAYYGVEDELVLVLDQYAIRWSHHVVYENEKREESIAFLLHKDGVGEIRIGPGAVGAETEQFVEILADEYHKIVSDEDVVTRFWNADFEHISYRVLDDYLSGEYAELRNADDDAHGEGDVIDHEEFLPSLEDKGRVIVQPADPLVSIDDYLRRLIMRTCTSSDESEREAYFQSMVGSFFSVSNEEMALYHDELTREKEADGLAAFAETIFVFTLLQDNPSAVRDVSGVLERIVEFAAADRHPDTLARLLCFVRDFRNDQRATEEVEELCAHLESRLSEPSLVAALGEMLINGETMAPETLEYFRLIGRASVDPLLRVLHHVDDKKVHRDMCDVLLEILGDNVTDIIDRFDVDNPQIASDAVYIASKAESPRLTPSMQELVYYPDRKVKEQMIELVARLDEEGVSELLLGAMNDSDKHIRCRAMDAASLRGDGRIKERLHELAFSREAAEHEFDEQEVIFRSLGRVGDAATVERLAAMIEKKGLRLLTGNRDQKILAVRALEGILDESALVLLDRLSDDSNQLVQSRAKRARTTLSAALLDGDTPTAGRIGTTPDNEPDRES